MKKTITIYHFTEVEQTGIVGHFSADRKHRAYLHIPFKKRESRPMLCIVGQNPSRADELVADRTVQYFEKFVFTHLPQYGGIIMLNLYSRFDTNKEEASDLIRPDCDRVLAEIITGHEDFLVAYGKIQNKGAYQFRERALYLKDLLTGKNIYKIDIGSTYPPHPGNSALCYHRFHKICPYEFADIS
ncbi:DUF1643 domain-containing protein [Desulfotalea psychrophila]|uniref:DUF1643 domain-containing protein n=1 Tax=Desulfotalea psychrophila (strain LSv54 / DSM 12343) TaxID=177439 RepID=Q6AK74_DESPS|nr:DUF1643 domain-containing protein [Desulfotalea psychrophila]CAG37252.1 unknown protein [Desulfotalea psychrophila LSv54]